MQGISLLMLTNFSPSIYDAIGGNPHSFQNAWEDSKADGKANGKADGQANGVEVRVFNYLNQLKSTIQINYSN